MTTNSARGRALFRPTDGPSFRIVENGGNVTNLSPIVAELERLYGVLRDNVFDGSLAEPDASAAFVNAAPNALRDQPVISVASRGRKRTVNGWYVPAVWSDLTDDLLESIIGDDDPELAPMRRAEIVVSSEVLRDDPIRIAVELARGMATAVVASLGDSIPTGPNYWHVSGWKHYAAAFGCVASVNPDQPSKGWSHLEPSAAFVGKVTPLLRPEVFDISRDADASTADDGRRSGMSVYRCKCSRMRAAVLIVARCERCGDPFVYADGRPVPTRVAFPASEAIAQGNAAIAAVYGDALNRDRIAATPNGNGGN